MRRAIAILACLPTAGAQNPAVWRFWAMGDGLYESFTRGVSLAPDGSLWVRHGQVEYMSILDGYSVTRIPNPNGTSSVYGIASGQAWAFAGNEFRLYSNSRWESRPVPEFAQRI